MARLSGGGQNPYLKRWMLFVDGENFAIRGRAFAEQHGIPLVEGTHFAPDTFLWFPMLGPRQDIVKQGQATGASHIAVDLQRVAVRAFYYTSVTGDDPRVEAVKERLWDLGFSPQVFKKPKRQAKAKGVDIALTKDVLSNAFLGNYDVAVLVAGDADYVPVVQEV